jgi:hypothetical protein
MTACPQVGELALPVAQKKKWAKTHRTNPKIRASCGLYEKDRAEASEDPDAERNVERNVAILPDR